jgi:hypothetical protein
MSLQVKDNVIIYEAEDKVLWSIPVSNLVFIGEYTTSAGPYGEDWFIVFAEKVDDVWQSASSMIDHESFWKELSNALNCEIAPALSWSTSWASNVFYPTELNGTELYRIVKTDTQPKTFWQRVFGKTDDERIELTDAVKKLFNI